MLYLVAGLIAGSIALLVVLVAQLIPSRSPAISRRLAELEQVGSPYRATQRRERQARRERWEGLLRLVGERAEGREGAETGALRQRLTQAGYRGPNAVSMYMGMRITLPVVLGLAGLFLAPLTGARMQVVFLSAAVLGIAGFIAPSFYLDRRVNARKKEIQSALPDALDLLVVCVEAGLGLNQAIMRVAEEIENVSMRMGEELGLVNLEIRAGTPREDALRHLGERSGVEDLRSLTAMLIQTDRFGTSVAQALRVHSETLRTKRKQRAEEAAAKTAIKMLFPLVLFIFPSLFVVILGPAVIQILAALSGVGQ